MIDEDIEKNIFNHVNKKSANITKIDFGSLENNSEEDSLEEEIIDSENEVFFEEKIDDILNDRFFDKNNSFFLENNIIKYFLKIGSSLIIEPDSNSPRLDKDSFEGAINSIGRKIQALINSNNEVEDKIVLLNDLLSEYTEKYSDPSSNKQEEINHSHLAEEKEALENYYQKLLDSLSEHYNTFK